MNSTTRNVLVVDIGKSCSGELGKTLVFKENRGPTPQSGSFSPASTFDLTLHEKGRCIEITLSA